MWKQAEHVTLNTTIEHNKDIGYIAIIIMHINTLN